ncbi:hypothetical protein VY88_17450 [Azospirillum thiophilum]|uniref:IraD/Gp25-like domain-containing protein n=1 Tax=Azospirillum thiophilum TaxID=528244 RepID=A0AAC8W037_9PROT|nr:type VI secretion system baseplate subunit TssE [Azospirillum thiophilum]ALG72572.1 hypothetical protein AL072_16065 [Azospirillum thiophilum]KJR64510.1 hypothetical protein VY88_17450 [Azospirillum thiophilum]
MSPSRPHLPYPGRAPKGRALLFERLVDDEPERTAEPAPFRVVDERGMLDSISRELSWLLNTRAPLSVRSDYAAPFRSTVDYGGPDVGRSGERNREELLAVAQEIAATVTAFEPRLTSVTVAVDWATLKNRRVAMELSALMRFARIMLPVSFAIYLDGDGQAEVGHGR